MSSRSPPTSITTRAAGGKALTAFTIKLNAEVITDQAEEKAFWTRVVKGGRGCGEPHPGGCGGEEGG